MSSLVRWSGTGQVSAGTEITAPFGNITLEGSLVVVGNVGPNVGPLSSKALATSDPCQGAAGLVTAAGDSGATDSAAASGLVGGRHGVVKV
jgi:hypothetical protein